MCEPYTDPVTGVTGIRCPNAVGERGVEGPAGVGESDYERGRREAAEAYGDMSPYEIEALCDAFD